MISPESVLQGRLVRLRPVREDDLAAFARWYTDPEVIYWLHSSERPLLTEQEVRDRLGPGPVPDQVRWVIETVGGGQAIGLVHLVDIERHCGRAELAIAIGEKGYWGAGCGTEAIRLSLAHGFAELGLRRVWLITDADNEPGIRCYEKCGFRSEGLLRAHRTRYGEPLDMLVMGVLREDWEALAGR